MIAALWIIGGIAVLALVLAMRATLKKTARLYRLRGEAQ